MGPCKIILVVKRPYKGLKDAFLAVQMPRKSSGLVLYSILSRKCTGQWLIGMQSSKLAI